MAEYRLVPALSEAKILDYVELFSLAFAGDSKLTAKYLNWLYVENPHGQVIGTDAFDGDRLAAHYAIMPRKYVIDGRRYDAALSINTATHPDHQGRGLFTRLAEATYTAAADGGVAFVIGAANANSVGGFTRKLGFDGLGQIRLYPGLDAPDPGQDELDLSWDAAWLQWRLANPSRTYAVRRNGKGRFSVSTRVKGIPFHLARRLEPSNIERALAKTGQTLPLPGLAPVFGPTPQRRPALPLRYQPSPWHVIWRTLAPGLDAELPRRLRMDGLSMDTF